MSLSSSWKLGLCGTFVTSKKKQSQELNFVFRFLQIVYRILHVCYESIYKMAKRSFVCPTVSPKRWIVEKNGQHKIRFSWKDWVLGCCAVYQSGRSWTTLRRNVLLPSLGLTRKRSKRQRKSHKSGFVLEVCTTVYNSCTRKSFL
jgi:hypothetical protein